MRYYNAPDDAYSGRRAWMLRHTWTCPMYKVREFRMPHAPKVMDGMVSLRVGPGGTLCECCFPAPGSKKRKIIIKHARRKAERMMIKEQLEYLKALEED